MFSKQLYTANHHLRIYCNLIHLALRRTTKLIPCGRKSMCHSTWNWTLNSTSDWSYLNLWNSQWSLPTRCGSSAIHAVSQTINFSLPCGSGFRSSKLQSDQKCHTSPTWVLPDVPSFHDVLPWLQTSFGQDWPRIERHSSRTHRKQIRPYTTLHQCQCVSKCFKTLVISKGLSFKAASRTALLNRVKSWQNHHGCSAQATIYSL